MKKNIKANIQLWRAFACACVFMVHFGQRIGFDGILRQLTDFGSRGVQMFFIISGYLIANSFYSYGHQDTKLFISKKLIKLMPLYYIVMIYYFIVHTFLLRDIPADPHGFGWIRYILPLNGILPPADTYFWDNLGITWTIPCFFAAYITLPIILKSIRTYKSAAVLLVVSFLLRYVPSIAGGWFQILESFCYFCEGIFLYFTNKEKKEIPVYVILFCLILAYLAIAKINLNLYSFIFMIMILATENMEIQSNWLKKWLSISDKYSYTMYLVHGIVFIHCLDRYHLGGKIESIIAILGTAILTYFVYTYLEHPMQKKLTSLLRK